MPVDRKGLLTSNQEKLFRTWLKDQGVKGVIARVAIRLIDNQLIDPLIDKLPDETKEKIYKIFDEIFDEVNVSLASDPPGPGQEPPKKGD